MGFSLLAGILAASLIAAVYHIRFNDSGLFSDNEGWKNDQEGNGIVHPLFLTPLIMNGQIDEARRKSLVEHESLRQIISYSGYLTVHEEYKSNLFFWYFPAQINSGTAPVVIWLQGGPGESSLIGLFTENGPIRITEYGTIELRESTWAKPFNMLYIDNPVGAGYSFTEDEDGYVDNQLSVGIQLYQAIDQFFKMFPELKANELYITGEGFAEKYVIASSYAIHTLNSVLENQINLKGLAIFGGSLDETHQVVQDNRLHYELQDSGRINILFEYEKKIQNVIDERGVFSIPSVISLVRESTKIFTSFSPQYDQLSTDNYREEKDSKILSEFMENYGMKQAMHVGNRSFIIHAEKVRKSMEEDMSVSLGNILAGLLEHYRVLIVNGEFDTMRPYSSFTDNLMEWNWNGRDEFRVADRQAWIVGTAIAGYVQNAGNLTQVMMRNSKHFVLKDQPIWALDLITKFTNGENITDDVYNHSGKSIIGKDFQ